MARVENCIENWPGFFVWVINVCYALGCDMDMVGHRYNAWIEQNCIAAVGVFNNRLPCLFRIRVDASMVTILEEQLEVLFRCTRIVVGWGPPSQNAL